MTLARGIATLTFVLAGACSDAGGNESTTTPDAGSDAGPIAPDSGIACTAPAPADAPPWLDAYLKELSSKLTGETEIAPGVKLSDRSTPARRDAARAYLSAELAALGIQTSEHDYGDGANVVGRLEPTIPGSEWLVVGAHFDTVTASAGANDNATGVVAVLAAARALKDLPCRSRGILFVLFDQEEVGLLGSRAFAKQQQEAGTAIHAAHTIDQVGWDSDGDRRFELELPTDALLAEYEAGATAVGAKVIRTKTPSSDHMAFRELGIDAVGITEEYVNGDTTPYFHTPNDKLATVDFGYQAIAVRLVTYVVAREVGAQ
jgi:hypothetical protein